MKYLKALLPLILLLSQMQFLHAANPLNSNEALHAAGHIGGTYILTHGTEVLCKKIAGKDRRVTCLLVGASTAIVASVLKEAVLDQGETKARHLKGLGEDAVGIGLAATFITIDW